MATAVARLGDTLSHGGTITSASPNWQCNGIPIARVGDTANCSVHGLVT
ncbi:MAG: PAAR domain-containing protein, partial [Dyella sp.]|nr:PAAR domain-containing protein [Dyella sp.]